MTRIDRILHGRGAVARAIALAGLLAAFALPALAAQNQAESTNQAAGTNMVTDTNTAAVPGAAVETNDPVADAAWKEASKLLRAPPMPAEWYTNAPTPEVEAAYYLPLIAEATAKARDFYTRFPNHPKADDARRMEYNLLVMAVLKYHDTNQTEHLAALRKEHINDPGTSPEDRFDLQLQEVENAAMAKKPEGQAAVTQELEKGVRELQKEYPKRPELYVLLLQIVPDSDPDKAKAMLKEIVDNAPVDQLRQVAAGQLKQLEALGKPFAMKYTAVDGRKVDLAKLKGKVVLIDFWATWCGPCVAEMPVVKAAYDKLHRKGFEIIGVSLDQDQAALKKFVKEKDMAWPQYFDGQIWQNKLAAENGVNRAPTMWLVDKKGYLIDLNAWNGLEEKVTKLLAK
jgi:thiol-disulfide isomerase/thioredoxin